MTLFFANSDSTSEVIGMPAKGNVASDKVLYWHNIMVRFEASGLSGIQFCKQESLKYTSFSDWRQRFRKKPHGTIKASVSDWISIIETARAYPAGVQKYCADNGICQKMYYKRFKDLKTERPEWNTNLHGKNGGRKKGTTKASLGADNPMSQQSFVPVQIVESAAIENNRATIDVILPNAIAVRLTSDCSPEFLKMVVSTLGDC